MFLLNYLPNQTVRWKGWSAALYAYQYKTAGPKMLDS